MKRPNKKDHLIAIQGQDELQYALALDEYYSELEVYIDYLEEQNKKLKELESKND